MSDAEYLDWIGRQAKVEDLITADPVKRLSSTLDRDDATLRDGEPIPPLAHWLFFLPSEKQSALGPDGHPARGGFLPPVNHLPRRMWAGSRLWFLRDVNVGMRLTRTSTIADVKVRSGSTGPLIFVTVRHEIAEGSGSPLIVDEHDIVYRRADTVAAKAADRAPARGLWRRDLTPDAVMLFRYSALTFNGHRIHYDRPYVTQVEKYPGLIVHGPLIATLLLDLVRRELPNERVATFSFKALSPLFDGARMSVNGGPSDEPGKVALWAANADEGLVMKAEVTLS